MIDVEFDIGPNLECLTLDIRTNDIVNSLVFKSGDTLFIEVNIATMIAKHVVLSQIQESAKAACVWGNGQALFSGFTKSVFNPSDNTLAMFRTLSYGFITSTD